MAVADGRGVLVYKEMGLVSQVFDEPTLATLQGHLAIGHTRYSTTGGSRWENAQPAFKTNAAGGGIALAHNGNLTNTGVLAESLAAEAADGDGAGSALRSSSDTDVMAELLAREADLSLEEAIVRTMPRLEGAFSLVIMDERTLYGVRDRHGVRPLCIGKLPGGWVIASETAALDIVGATLVREVEPGEVVAIDEPRPAGPALRPARAQAVRVRARLPGQGRLHPRRPERPPGPPGARRRPGRRGAGRRRPGHPRPGHGLERRRRLRRGQRHPLRRGPDEEPLCRPHLHPAEPDHAPARHPDQAQPAQGGHPGAAAGRGRRLDRARQHHQGDRRHAPGGRRPRGPRPHHLAPGALALLLRHRHAHPGRAGRQRPAHRRGGQLRRRRLARLPVAGGPDRDRGRPGGGARTACARRVSRGTTRSRWRPRSRARSCSRAWPPSARWTASR